MLRFHQVLFGFGAIIVGLWIAAAEARQARLSDAQIADALTALKSADSAEQDRGTDLLRSLPCASVGPPLVRMLEEKEQAQAVRRLAFEVLAACSGEKNKLVESTLLRGVLDDDSRVVKSSVFAFADASPSVREDAAHKLASRWSHWAPPGTDPPGWLYDLTTRIGGISHLAQRLVQTADEERNTALGVLGYYGAETYGQFDGDDNLQRSVRQFVIDSLLSPSMETRQAAFEALLPSFGDDGVIFHTPTDYEFDPDMIKALQHVADNDPDQVLRERAANTLKRIDLDRTAEKILKRRNEKQGGKNEDNKRENSDKKKDAESDSGGERNP